MHLVGALITIGAVFAMISFSNVTGGTDVATAMLVVLSAIAVPVIGGVHDRARVRAASRYLSARLHAARLEALRRNTAVGFRFDLSLIAPLQAS